jgi:predicted ABC-type ATPase
VPIEKIVKRYERSLANLPLAIDLAHRVYAFDNSVDGVEARLCARTQDGQLRKVYGALPDWVAAAAEALPRHPSFADVRTAG